VINPPDGATGRPRYLPVAALLCAGVLFAALGVWQIHRMAWKEALIARVNASASTAPVPVVGLTDAQAAQEYRRVIASGVFDPHTTTLVTATSELGNGYWDMVALYGQHGAIWVNRGFVPLGARRVSIAAATPTAPLAIIGYIRKSEPKGGFLRANHSEDDRWYSRDLPAMRQKRSQTYATDSDAVRLRDDIFIDAQSETPAPKAGLATSPISGLTVISFPNNHLSYAITWFTLCLLSIAMAVWLARQRN